MANSAECASPVHEWPARTCCGCPQCLLPTVRAHSVEVAGTLHECPVRTCCGSALRPLARQEEDAGGLNRSAPVSMCSANSQPRWGSSHAFRPYHLLAPSWQWTWGAAVLLCSPFQAPSYLTGLQ